MFFFRSGNCPSWRRHLVFSPWVLPSWILEVIGLPWKCFPRGWWAVFQHGLTFVGAAILNFQFSSWLAEKTSAILDLENNRIHCSPNNGSLLFLAPDWLRHLWACIILLRHQQESTLNLRIMNRQSCKQVNFLLSAFDYSHGELEIKRLFHRISFSICSLFSEICWFIVCQVCKTSL